MKPLYYVSVMQNDAAAMENCVEIPQKIKIDLPCDPAIHLLGIYPKKTKALVQKDICISTFAEVPFSTAKIGKQPKCLSE